MAKYFGIIMLLVVYSAQQSLAASDLEEMADGLISCINKEWDLFKEDFSTAFKGLTNEHLCGPENLENFSEQWATIWSQLKQCKNIACYLTHVPAMRDEVMEMAKKCTNNFINNGPLIHIGQRAYQIVDKCVVQQNSI